MLILLRTIGIIEEIQFCTYLYILEIKCSNYILITMKANSTQILKEECELVHSFESLHRDKCSTA